MRLLFRSEYETLYTNGGDADAWHCIVASTGWKGVSLLSWPHYRGSDSGYLCTRTKTTQEDADDRGRCPMRTVVGTNGRTRSNRDGSFVRPVVSHGGPCSSSKRAHTYGAELSLVVVAPTASSAVRTTERESSHHAHRPCPDRKLTKWRSMRRPRVVVVIILPACRTHVSCGWLIYWRNARRRAAGTASESRS